MPNLFGIDIAGILNSALGSSGPAPLLPATLSKIIEGDRDPDDLAAGPERTSSDYTATGMISSYSASKIDGTIIQANDREVMLLGASIEDGAIPEMGDRITIEGEEYVIVGIPDRDPAAATYTCQVR